MLHQIMFRKINLYRQLSTSENYVSSVFFQLGLFVLRPCDKMANSVSAVRRIYDKFAVYVVVVLINNSQTTILQQYVDGVMNWAKMGS